MVSSLILLRSLRVYVLKQLFFSISVNSGFRSLAAWRPGKQKHYSHRFQRIIVNYRIPLFSLEFPVFPALFPRPPLCVLIHRQDRSIHLSSFIFLLNSGHDRFHKVKKFPLLTGKDLLIMRMRIMQYRQMNNTRNTRKPNP